MESFRKMSAAGRGVLLLLAALAVFGTSPAAHAFKLSPIRVEFTPSGRGANQAFLLENDVDETVAVQISMLTRTIDIDGKEHNAPADDDFVVYPSQVLLKPGQTQTVRVQWVGDAEPDKELAYRILAEQLPIDVTKEQQGGARINFVIRYMGAIYIVPRGARPDIVIEGIEAETGNEGERQLAVMFHNRGKAHAVLRGLTLTLHSGERSVELTADDLKGIAGENLLAESKRRAVVPWPAELPDGAVRATFDYHRRQ